MGPHGAPWGPHGAPWGPLGPLGPHGAHGAPSSPVVVRRNFEKFTKFCIFPFLGSKMGQKKVEIEGVGPPWRDPRRNSAQNGGGNVKNYQMATRLRPKRLLGGPLGFRAQLAHPWDSPWGSRSRKHRFSYGKLQFSMRRHHDGTTTAPRRHRGGTAAAPAGKTTWPQRKTYTTRTLRSRSREKLREAHCLNNPAVAC